MASLLLESALRSLLIAAGTAVVLWGLRIKTAAVRHAAWTAVVMTMLLLPIWLAGGLTVSLPVLQSPAVTVGLASNPVNVATGAPAVTQPPTTSPTAPAGREPVREGSWGWQELLFGVYLSGVFVLVARLLVGTVHANRLRRSAVIEADRATSGRCATPITVGWFRPVLILPTGWQRWPAAQLDAVLTHEQEHARRHDPLVQWFALLNRAIFWFHPLSWWLERRLATLAEEACDAAVLAAGHSAQDYSDYLLEMARSITREGRRLNVVGMAMPGSGLPQRMRQIFDGLPMRRTSRARVLCTVALCAMSSVTFATGTLAPRHQATIAPGAPSGSPSASSAAQTSAPLKIDVASIKPCPGLPPPGTGRGLAPSDAEYSVGFVHWNCVSLTELIDQAYAEDRPLLNMLGRPREDSPKRVRGGPSWIDTDRFTIEAKIAGDSNKPEMRLGAYYAYMQTAMLPALRTLLADRFKLKVHRATEQQAMYALVVAKGGLNKDKVMVTAPGDCWAWTRGTPRTPPPGFAEKPMCGNIRGGGRGGINKEEYTGRTMGSFAAQLAATMDRFVIDKTGLDGMYNFVLQYAENENTPPYYSPNDPYADRQRAAREARKNNPPDGPNIFKALEALGLKLEPTKGPAEYFLIDYVERPTPDEPAPARATGAGAGR